jgi:prefoldin alpha subunit
MMPSSEAPGDDESERLRYMYSVYQEQYGIVSQRLDEALGVMQRLNAALQTLENYKGIKGTNAFLPSGEGLFLKSKIDDSESFVIDVGGGYLVESPIESAKEVVSSRLEGVNAYMKKMYSERGSIEKALNEIGARLGAQSGVE